MHYRISMAPSLAFLFVTHLMMAEQALSRPDVEELMRAGVAAQQRGDYRSAIASFQKALTIDPDMPEARERLGESLAADGQLDAAIEEDRRLLATFPDRPGVRFNLAFALYKKNDVEHARTELEALHAANPTDLPAAKLLANTYIKMGRESQAIEILMPLEPGRDTDMELEYSLAFALMQSARDSEGLPRMEKVARNTQSANAWTIAGASRLNRREFAEARSDLTAAIKLDSSLPGLNTMAGQAVYALGDAQSALPYFEAGLRANPTDATANLYVGIFRLNQGDLEGARPLLELAVQLQPKFPLAQLKLAELNGMTGNYAEAIKALEDLEKSDPDWPDPHTHLATLYYKVHRVEDGQREREIVKQLEARQQREGPRNN